MSEQLRDLANKVHSLSNRFAVIEKAFEVFAKQNPENKLNTIAKESLDDSIKLMSEIEKLSLDLVGKETTKAWFNKLQARTDELEDMFGLKLQFIEKKFEVSGVDESLFSQFDEILMNTLEYIETLGGSEATIDLINSPSQTFLALTDNATEVVQKDSAEIQSIETFCAKVNAQLEFKSIQGIGNNFKILF